MGRNGSGTRIVPDPDTRKVKQVQRKFELRANGYSVDAIRETVIGEGFMTPTEGKKYHRSVINARLRNPFYRGRFIWQGIEYEGSHELIIPPHVLRAVDASFGKRGQKARPLGENGIFSGGLLHCADVTCACAVVYDPKKKAIKTTGETKVYHLYRCSNSKKTM